MDRKFRVEVFKDRKSGEKYSLIEYSAIEYLVIEYSAIEYLVIEYSAIE